MSAPRAAAQLFRLPGVARIFVPPATTRAGTAQRAIPTIALNTYCFARIAKAGASDARAVRTVNAIANLTWSGRKAGIFAVLWVSSIDIVAPRSVRISWLRRPTCAWLARLEHEFVRLGQL